MRSIGLGALVVTLGAPSLLRADCPTGAPGAVVLDRGCTPAVPKGVSLVPDLSIIKTPQAPAFTALGVTPSAIERPATPTAAAVEVATGVVRAFLTPGNTVAAQLAPYWMYPHPEVSGRDIEEDPWGAWYRDFTISFATAAARVDRRYTAKAAETESLALTRAALGARTTIFPGWPSDEARACRRVVDAYTLNDARLKGQLFAAAADAWRNTHPAPRKPALEQRTEPRLEDFPDTAEYSRRKEAHLAWKAYLEAMRDWTADLQAVLDSKNIELWRAGYHRDHPVTEEVRRCFEVMHHRTGFLWDAAAAAIGDTPSDLSSGSGAALSATAWSTMAYVFSRGRVSDREHRTPYDLSLLGVFRLGRENLLGRYLERRQLDYGMRLVLALERWGFSLEGLGRHDDELPALDVSGLPRCRCTFKVGGVIDYHLKSGMWATLSGGTDFRELTGPRTPIRVVAQFQVNFGLDRMLVPDRSASQPAGGGGR